MGQNELQAGLSQRGNVKNATVDGKTYADRRQRLVDNVVGNGYWDETTSFILAESPLDTVAFAKMACAGLSHQRDMVFIFDPADMSAVYFGPLASPDVLRSFFPKLKKLP